MKVLFIARRFPPSIGGMEQFAYDLSKALPNKDVELVPITWGGSSRLTLFVGIPWLFLRAFWKLLTDQTIDVIHMQDAVQSPPGWLLAYLFDKPWLVVTHGLDLTFDLEFYQKVNVFFARKADAMVAISESTAEEARKRGIDTDKLTVIPLGVDNQGLPKIDRAAVLQSLALTEESTVLLTVGRLAKRKGVAWFIDAVLPQLVKDSLIHYVIIGEGTERPAIEAAITQHKLDGRVHMLGVVDAETKQQWLMAADIFVMPNIVVPGDMEGFGIVAHEAALAELPVVASNLEGIAQALQDGKNGTLVKAKDAAGYKKAIQALVADPKKRAALGKKARAYTLEHFGWSTIAKRYRDIYTRLIS